MPDLHLVPGLWAIDGYGKLVTHLKAHFTLNEVSAEQPGNLLLFHYDWRLSNVVSARRLHETASRELERWRKYTRNCDAKLVLICHSMGGLVARWFLEVLCGREITRQLITIGTPYQGSVNALRVLINGLSVGLGPLGLELSRLARSLPSLYQLLPTYPCLNVGDGILKALTDAPDGFAIYIPLSNGCPGAIKCMLPINSHTNAVSNSNPVNDALDIDRNLFRNLLIHKNIPHKAHRTYGLRVERFLKHLARSDITGITDSPVRNHLQTAIDDGCLQDWQML